MVISRFILSTCLINFILGIYCPNYCRCLVSNRLRHVMCVGKGLISVELDVPHTVQWLQLSDNSIYELKDNIFEILGLKHLVKLSLDNNGIQSVGLNAFSGLEKIEEIDLSYNHLYSISPGVFEKNPSLMSIFLQGNPIRFLRRNHPFLISSSIQVLDISNCRISYIPELSLSSLPSLVKLNISSNHIETLDHQSFEVLNHLEEIDLSNNRIVCDSAIDNFLKWVSFKSISLVGSFCKKSATILPKLKTMEKIIMLDKIENTVPEFETTIYSNTECPCTINELEGGQFSENFTSEIFTIQEKKYKHDYMITFFVLTFIIGVVIGITLTICCWICSRVVKFRKRGNIYYAMHFECPPPAYTTDVHCS